MSNFNNAANTDMVDVPIINVGVIDVMRPYLREAFGGPEHDYRLEAVTPTGGRVTFHRGATADDVHAYWAREGWVGGQPGIAHRLTEVEAHAITNILAAVEHIPVDAECRVDAVHLRPRRELTTTEKVTVLRAVRAVSDAPVVWEAVA